MNAQKLRYVFLIFFLVFMTWLGYRHQVMGGGPSGSATVDALCPFGGLEGIYGYLRDGIWLRRLAPSALVLFIAVTALTLLLGRVFCGWICPMGALTELSSRLARRLGLRSRRLPAKIDFAMRGVKYVLLALILYFTWHLGTLVFRDYDPWKAWMHLSAGFREGQTAFMVLAGVLAAEFFIERFWCRYLCPFGAAFGIMQKVSRTKITRDPIRCISCKKCDRSCPTGLNPSLSLTLPAADCIACGKCIDVCPKEKAITFNFFKLIDISPVKLGIIGILVFTAFWGGAKTTGAWSTYATPPSNAQISPAEKLYGWMNIAQASEIMGLSPEEVFRISGLPAGCPTDVPMKKLPGEPDELIIAKLTEWHAAQLKPARLPNVEEIRGSATLRQISDTYGIPVEKILEAAWWPAGLDPSMPLKTHAANLNTEVSDIRNALKKMIK